MDKRPEAVYDELLVLRCQDGDRIALEELVERWQRRLWRHAWQLTGRPDVAWDIMQEVWIAIVRGVGTLNDPASFPNWAYRIVGNKCADWGRRQSREKRLDEEVRRADSEPVDDPIRREAKEGELDRIRRALRRLPGDRRAILSMFYLEGMSMGDIAQALEIPLGTVKSRLHYAREHLRSELEETS